MQNNDNINITLQYPHNDKFDYFTYLNRLDLDKVREDDIKSGKGFIIDDPRPIKKDIKLQGGIFSSRFGNTLQDADSYNGRYRCDCGMLNGTINHGERCELCNTLVKYRDDDVSIFGYMVLKEPYCIIHPNLYRSLEAFIGGARLDRILEPNVEVDQNGHEITNWEYLVEHNSLNKKDEPYKGIGILNFRDHFDEIMNFYLTKYPAKKNYYDDIMNNRFILFTRTIPVYSSLLRPVKVDGTGGGSLRYEKTNENYNLLSKLVYDCNNDRLKINRKIKDKYLILYDIQTNFNIIYTELKDILAKKKGDIRSACGGRYSFSCRSIIAQGVDLKPDQIRLPFHALCELLQQVIINIIVRTYGCTYADAYKKWYKAQITGKDKIVYDIIEGLIKDSDGGLPVLINRNPTISFGGILFMRVIGINMNYTMSVPLQILKLIAGDFDGDTLNILYLFNKDFIRIAEQVISPRQMFISKNDGRCNADMIHSRDTIINANSLKSLCEYTNEEIEKIKRLQNIQEVC